MTKGGSSITDSYILLCYWLFTLRRQFITLSFGFFIYKIILTKW